MAPCLSKLPSVCLEAIFERLPLVDLLRSIGLVCTSWFKSRRTELMRRKRLVLLEYTDIYSLNDYRNYSSSHTTELIQHVRRDDGSPWLTLESLAAIELNALAVPGGMQTISFILQLKNFSSITRLHLFFECSDSVLEQLIMLIKHFSNHLVDLKILMNFDLDINVYNHDTAQNELHPNVANLFVCLNCLPSLKHLQLSATFTYFSMPSHTPELLSCLSRLTTFTFGDYGSGWLYGWIFASLKKYARNATSIDIHTAMDLQIMHQFDNQLASKFNVLTLLYDGLPGQMAQCYDVMRQFCSRFSSLTKLELAQSLNFMPMTMLARCLSLLPQLVHLHLRLGNIPPVEGGQPEEEEGDEMQQDRAQQEVVQVPSVRLLTLSPFITKSHLDSERLFIPEIFPNLQVLCLDHRFTECPECAIGPSIGAPIHVYYDIYLAHRIIRCTRLTRLPFRRCANLHTVALGSNETLITLDEL